MPETHGTDAGAAGRRRGRLSRRTLVFVLLPLAAMLGFAGVALAQEDAPDDDERLTERFERFVARDFSEDGPRHSRDGRHGGTSFGSDALSELLGLTTAEIRTALADGSTIAELAEANGATAQDAVDAIVAEAAARVAEHGKDVDHDELVAKVTARVNGEAGEFEGKRGYRGFHDKRGFGCADDDAADADADDGAAAAAAV